MKRRHCPYKFVALSDTPDTRQDTNVHVLWMLFNHWLHILKAMHSILLWFNAWLLPGTEYNNRTGLFNYDALACMYLARLRWGEIWLWRNNTGTIYSLYDIFCIQTKNIECSQGVRLLGCVSRVTLRDKESTWMFFIAVFLGATL